MTENQIKGTVRELGGKAQESVGNAVGDRGMQGQGLADQVAGKAEQVYGDVKDAVASAAGSAAAKLGGAAHLVSEQVSDIGNRAYEKTDEAAKCVGDYVREEPVAVLLGVAAVSMLAGFLLGRPCDDGRSVELGRFRASYR